MGHIGEPVTDEEYVLRRIPLKKYDPAQPEAPIERDQFLGNNDPDGPSVYRESVDRTAPERILDAVEDPERRKEFLVVRISTSFIFGFGFTLIDDPQDDVDGHCLIPEMNQTAYRADKRRRKEIAVQFSKFAEIVYTPPGFAAEA